MAKWTSSGFGKFGPVEPVRSKRVENAIKIVPGALFARGRLAMTLYVALWIAAVLASVFVLKA